MEDRQSRLFLALILSMGIWMGVNYFFFPSTPKKNSETKEANVDKPSNKKQDQIQTKEKKNPRSPLPLKERK
ncbi:hypothetical protein LEP1GSC043_1257 [Leptospira weilii str. Ecochallenge]|uniref:Membrane protein insertase YidC n=2 Tax=Leptospira weilii TaxID=28184 RepID=N1U8F5_9LEPT|nr:hypothetical protein LEP1GSC038_4622 [Leptospira weilii str. 2006001855]EMY14446.1 hypothetical protein LEP1GSC043_1257 [Leptospira weilii str. Ecochallenge]